MVYHIAQYLKHFWPIWPIIHYTPLRSMIGFLSTIGFSFLAGPWFIAHSKRYFRSSVRPWTPDRHKVKNNLPTMGGIFILTQVVLNTIIWCDLSDPRIWLMIGTMIGFGAIGALDDVAKIKQAVGISARMKFGLQVIVALIITILWLLLTKTPTTIAIPFFKELHPNIGFFFILWAAFIIIGCSNAVNLTDGLDGLAIGSLMPNFLIFSIFCYLAGNMALANYLHIPYTHTTEIAVIGSILMGALVSFLWYNSYPAQIFMGDIGSLSLGASLALMALFCKQELLLVIAGGVFVCETISVIIQVFYYRLYKKRFFRMAPIHHHFELLGWHEAKITVRFTIISLILCMIALTIIQIN